MWRRLPVEVETLSYKQFFGRNWWIYYCKDWQMFQETNNKLHIFFQWVSLGSITTIRFSSKEQQQLQQQQQASKLHIIQVVVNLP